MNNFRANFALFVESSSFFFIRLVRCLSLSLLAVAGCCCFFLTVFSVTVAVVYVHFEPHSDEVFFYCFVLSFGPSAVLSVLREANRELQCH